MEKENATPTIAYFNHTPSGCFWYRIEQPMNMLKENGIDVKSISLEEDVEDTISAFQLYGAYPFSFERALRFLKENKKKIIYDTDDALDLIDPTNPFYYAVKKDANSVDEILQFCDEVTVSTQAMKEYMQNKTDKKITVIPNCYTPSEWTFPRPKREGIRIGFSGSATHVDDLVEVIPIIEKLQAKHNITFIIMGFGESSYEQWFKEFRYLATPEGKKSLTELDKRLAKIKFEWVPFIEYKKYPTTLINMALDIGICPLKDTPFNRCRSACKAMEYTLAGALALASDVEPYRNDHNSVKVKDGEWEQVLTHFIESPEGANHEYGKHLKWTQENRNVNTNLEALKKVYGII